ncbi:DUF421 domain-containing protein [Bacillus massiliigorillae]|uniref:DUF421 domain-containing protein n=1 Tax=Bacillus massiliigorillae TaxID=1243664 RepID=UPI00039E08F5|nr:DUF421 domain-containing protein [Bacillus massiliigorillae]
MDEVSLGLIALKVVIGFISLYCILLITGRTSISQLTPFHFIFILMLDDFLGHVIYENKLSIFKFLYAIGLWTLLMIILEFVTMKYIKIRFIIQRKPFFIIRNGKLDRNAVKKSRLDINQILSLLRQQRVFSIREVEFAILEPNGQLSVALKSKYDNLKNKDLQLPEQKIDLPITLIIDGEIIRNTLYENGLDEKWLQKELKIKGFNDVKNIFHAEWKKSEGLYISPK